MGFTLESMVDRCFHVVTGQTPLFYTQLPALFQQLNMAVHHMYGNPLPAVDFVMLKSRWAKPQTLPAVIGKRSEETAAPQNEEDHGIDALVSTQEIVGNQKNPGGDESAGDTVGQAVDKYITTYAAVSKSKAANRGTGSLCGGYFLFGVG
jgi:hypothetical protein